MRRPADDATQMHGSRMPRVEWIGDVVLAKLPGCPAGYVEELIVEGEVDVASKGRHRTEILKSGRQLVGVGRLCRDVYHLLDAPPAVLAVPEPYRRGEVFEVDYHAGEAVGFARIVGRSELQHYLIFLAQIQGLKVAPTAHVPDMKLMTIAALQ